MQQCFGPMRAVSIAVALWFAGWALPAGADGATAAADAEKVTFQWGVKIPLRDGTRLNATVYTPKDQRAPAPCIFTLTPYIAQTNHERAMYFAAHGLPFVTVDARGRGNSEGKFQPFLQEAADGHDIVEWLARQAYCNGKISMWGGSYLGYAQWVTAKEFPRHLATIVPVASPYMMVDWPARNNIFYTFGVQFLTYVSGRAAQDKIFADSGFWAARFRHWLESGKPFNQLDTIAGNPSATFQEWISHPHPDSYWDSYNPTAEQYARLAIPILTITGAYDGDQPGALMHYRQHMANASQDARERHYLIIGPWDHAGTRTPQLEFAGMNFGPASLVDLPKLHLEWYAWTMQGGPKPAFLQKNVAYYVMHADKWRYADTLEEVTAQSMPMYLDSATNASDLLTSGSLGERIGTGAPDRFVYDPRDLSAVELEASDNVSGAVEGFTNHRLVHARYGKQLVYHSAPFEKDTELSGFFKLSAWIALDQPDTDLAVNVYEVRQDGRSLPMSNDQMRARYRESLREPKLVNTKEPLLYEFDRFTFMSQQVKKGSRLRLVISPMTSFASQKNFNSGGVVAQESMEHARPVTVTLYHDKRRPSVLYVPMGHR